MKKRKGRSNKLSKMEIMRSTMSSIRRNQWMMKTLIDIRTLELLQFWSQSFCAVVLGLGFRSCVSLEEDTSRERDWLRRML